VKCQDKGKGSKKVKKTPFFQIEKIGREKKRFQKNSLIFLK